MRIAEYKQIDEHIEEYEAIIPAKFDEEGNIVSEEHKEIKNRSIPVMEMVYRYMTEEEIAEIQKQQEEVPQEEPSQLDRIEAQAMYTALMTDTLIKEE